MSKNNPRAEHGIPVALVQPQMPMICARRSLWSSQLATNAFKIGSVLSFLTFGAAYGNSASSVELKSFGVSTPLPRLYTENVPAESFVRGLSAATPGKASATNPKHENPVEVRDLKASGHGLGRAIQSMGPAPTQRPGEPQQLFWDRQNAYFQQKLTDDQIAYIDPHGGPDDGPDMPHLTARIPNGHKDTFVRWRLEVTYLRGNGWRADYVDVKDHFKRDEEDQVFIPTDHFPKPTFTREMPASEEWKIHEDPDWRNSIQQYGPFGGTASLYLWYSRNESEPTQPVLTFRIGGRNPDEKKVKSFIDREVAKQDARLWFAYVIAKEESRGYGDPEHQFYNQFFGRERRETPVRENGKPAYRSGWNEDKDWQCWANALPTYNLDRERYKGPQKGPGGYGLFQVTGNATDEDFVIPRSQIWSWQDNIRAGLKILQMKVKFVDARYEPLERAYSGCGSIPGFPQGIARMLKYFSGWDAFVCTAYNGLGLDQGSEIRLVRLPGFKGKQRTCWWPEVNQWIFLHNSQRYCERSFQAIEQSP